MVKSTLRETLLTLPSLIWLAIFFLAPALIIFLYSFRPADIYGGIEQGWTLQTLNHLNNSYFYKILWRSIWMSVLSTGFCLVLAVPMGYQLATIKPKWRRLLLMMIIIPFWSSFLIRIFAWKTILHPEGIFHQALVMLGIISPSTPLLYTNSAVVLVMVYTFLPFALLPIYTAAMKFDFQLIEAAMDLGASRWKAMRRVFIPGIQRGIVTAALMVFISAIGTYVIPDLVGGINSDMIGNKIAQKTFAERNIPEASGISLILIMIILVPLGLMMISTKKNRSLEAKNRGQE